MAEIQWYSPLGRLQNFSKVKGDVSGFLASHTSPSFCLWLFLYSSFHYRYYPVYFFTHRVGFLDTVIMRLSLVRFIFD